MCTCSPEQLQTVVPGCGGRLQRVQVRRCEITLFALNCASENLGCGSGITQDYPAGPLHAAV